MSNQSSGIGISGILAIIFTLAKLFGKITWSWWWVLCPIWIPTATALSVILLIFIACIVRELLR